MPHDTLSFHCFIFFTLLNVKALNSLVFSRLNHLNLIYFQHQDFLHKATKSPIRPPTLHKQAISLQLDSSKDENSIPDDSWININNEYLNFDHNHQLEIEEAELEDLEKDLTPEKKKGLRFLKDDLSMDIRQLNMVIQRQNRILQLDIEGQLRPKLEYFRSLGLDGEKLAEFVAKSPSTFGLNLWENIAPTVEWIACEGPFTTEEIISMLGKCPPLLTYSVMGNLDYKFTYFKAVLGFSEADFRKMMLKQPQILTMSLENNLFPKITFLHDTFLNDEVAVRKMLVKLPYILMLNLELQLIPRVEFFIDCLHLNYSELKKVFLKCPELFYQSNENLIETISFFELLGFNEDDLRKCLMKSPRMLVYSVANMAYKKLVLESKLRLEGKENLKRLLMNCPQLLSLNVELRIENFSRLLETMVGADDNTTREIIMRMPKVLCHAVQSTKQKIALLLEYGTKEQVRCALCQSPVILTCSVENRLKPRLNRLQKHGFDVAVLASTIAFTDARFDRYLSRNSLL